MSFWSFGRFSILLYMAMEIPGGRCASEGHAAAGVSSADVSFCRPWKFPRRPQLPMRKISRRPTRTSPKFRWGRRSICLSSMRLVPLVALVLPPLPTPPNWCPDITLINVAHDGNHVLFDVTCPSLQFEILIRLTMSVVSDLPGPRFHEGFAHGRSCRLYCSPSELGNERLRCCWC